MRNDLEEILLSEEAIRARIAEMAAEISRDYKGRCPTFVGVLKGCFLFLSDLMKQITIDNHVDFIMLSSYSGARSTGVVRTVLDLKENIENRDVVIVEDIVDSGLTMHYMLKNLRTRTPRSLEICTLLDKPSCRKAKVPIKYSGFTIPNKFVVGYGLDYREKYRNLPFIGVLKKSIVEGTEKCR